MTTLQEFISRMGQAGIEASKACEEYGRKRLEDLCTKEGDKFVPKIAKIRVGERDIEVPLICLMAPTRVDIEEFKVAFKTSVELDKDGQAKMSGHVGLLKKSLEVDAEIIFKVQDSVEGVELIREKLDKRLSEELGNG